MLQYYNIFLIYDSYLQTIMVFFVLFTIKNDG